MNTRIGKAKFKNFCILLGGGCNSTIVMGRLVEKLYTEKDDLMQWHTKAGNINTGVLQPKTVCSLSFSGM